MTSVSVPEIWTSKMSEILGKHEKWKLIILCPFNPILYGILRLSQLCGWEFYLAHQETMLRLLDWSKNLVHIIIGTRPLRMQNFRKITALFLEIWLHKVRLFMKERFIAFQCLPPKFNSYLMIIKSLFIIKNGFSDPRLFSLGISAIFKKKKIFHDLSFKMTVATPGE